MQPPGIQLHWYFPIPLGLYNRKKDINSKNTHSRGTVWNDFEVHLIFHFAVILGAAVTKLITILLVLHQIHQAWSQNVGND